MSVQRRPRRVLQFTRRRGGLAQFLAQLFQALGQRAFKLRKVGQHGWRRQAEYRLTVVGQLKNQQLGAHGVLLS